ncbi:MAG: zf-HC2 domain-containing protein [Chloroflexota bacterium]
MSNHVTEWLNAYFDGELHGSRLQQVQAHLITCKTCQDELDALGNVSGLLHEVPLPDFPSPERFATQVNLLLPHKRTLTPSRRLFEVGWWLIPVGIVATWVFITTAILLSDVVSTAKNFGILDNTTASFISAPSDTADVTSTLGQFGMLRGSGLQWAETTETYTRSVLPQVILQVAVALLYLTWFAIWWARHTHQGQEQLLEG